jgi:hypothetical protein
LDLGNDGCLIKIQEKSKLSQSRISISSATLRLLPPKGDGIYLGHGREDKAFRSPERDQQERSDMLEYFESRSAADSVHAAP